MIILEDSDLHAVINCLMIIDYSLSKIWIQKSIKKEFLMFKKKYLNYSRKCPIDIFQSQQELLAISTPRNCLMNIISIWSEDIVAAKNLASCFDVYYLNYVTQHIVPTEFILNIVKIISFFCYSGRYRIHKYTYGFYWWPSVCTFCKKT